MKLLDIAVRPAKDQTMQTVTQAMLTTRHGLEGDYRDRAGRRQVSILPKTSWQEACDELGQPLSWLIRRANLLVEMPPFSPMDVGRQLQIGEAVIEICVETDPCYKMDQQVPGLKQAMLANWRGGACGRVINSGLLRVGQPIIWR